MKVKRWMLGAIRSGETAEEFYLRTTYTYRLQLILWTADNRLECVRHKLILELKPKPEVRVYPSQYEVGYNDGYTDCERGRDRKCKSNSSGS